VERRPEAVARPGEVVPDGARPQAGVDPDEDDGEIAREDVGDRSTVSALQLCFRRTPRRRRGSATS
jgi:hypothetical protein